MREEQYWQCNNLLASPPPNYILGSKHQNYVYTDTLVRLGGCAVVADVAFLVVWQLRFPPRDGIHKEKKMKKLMITS